VSIDGLGSITLGDVIVGVGGQRVASLEDLLSMIEQFVSVREHC
jgi:hypothetical protein